MRHDLDLRWQRRDAGFEDLRELCAASGDQVSLATGMAGMVMALSGHNRNDEATSLGSELTALLEAIGIPMLTATLLSSATYARAQVGDMVEALGWRSVRSIYPTAISSLTS